MKILFMNQSNINGLGGYTIQQVHEINMWAKNNDVFYLSFSKLYNAINVRNIDPSVKLIFPTLENGIDAIGLNNVRYVEEARKIILNEGIDLVIIRGAKLNFQFFTQEPVLYREKCVAYITDIGNIEHGNLIKALENAKFVKVQNRKYFQKIGIPIPENMIEQAPLVTSFEGSYEKEFDIMYAGSIAKGWGVEQFLDLVLENPDLKAVMVYTKFGIFTDEEIKVMKDKMARAKNLTIYESLPLFETRKLFAKTKISYCYRDEIIDNNLTFEISTKLLECMDIGCIPIVRDCPINREVLPDNEKYFCKNEKEVRDSVFYFLKNGTNLAELKTNSERFLPESTYNRIIEQMKVGVNDE